MDAGAAVYGYDGEGRRTKKTAGSETTYTFYGPGGIISEFTTTSGVTQAASTDRTTYRTSEHTGSAVLLLASNGTVLENNRTLPYGEAWLTDIVPINTKKFTTYQRDSESGLDYAMNRYYANSAGRFLSVDKAPLTVSAPTGLNRYTYVKADPINLIDPDGNVEVVPSPIELFGWLYRGNGGGELLMFGGLGNPVPVEPSPETLAQMRWNQLSEDCQKGLTGAMSQGTASAATAMVLRLQALDRALAAKDTLAAAGNAAGVEWTLLAAIGIKETGFVNRLQAGGQGVGVFQIDLGQHPEVSVAHASNLAVSAGIAAHILAANSAILAASGITGNAAVLSSYNHGVGTVSANFAAGRPLDISSTTGENNQYGTITANLTNCFK